MNDYNCRRVRSGNMRGNIIFYICSSEKPAGFSELLFHEKKDREGKRTYPTVKVILQNTRAKIDKLHKGIMNRNVQNKKIKTQNGKNQHAAGRTEIERKINLFWQKSEKWLDNKTFRVYTVLVSHNGLVRQKGEHRGSGWMGRTGKFVKNAERLPSTRVELCVSAQI